MLEIVAFTKSLSTRKQPSSSVFHATALLIIGNAIAASFCRTADLFRINLVIVTEILLIFY